MEYLKKYIVTITIIVTTKIEEIKVTVIATVVNGIVANWVCYIKFMTFLSLISFLNTDVR